jgi:putative endopeptidase
VATLAMQPLPMLPRPFMDARSHVLRAIGQTLPEGSREEMCFSSLQQDLGEALGRKYVERELPPETKRKVEEMVADMRAALREQIGNSAWMSAESKRQALEKLAALHVGVGYPDVWRDYSALPIDRGDLLGNRWRAAQFETERWMHRIGRPPDRRQWEGTPITGNLYYMGNLNAVELPACELVAAFDPGKPDAFNYAALGGGIGHEISHAFDDSGRKYDAQGILRESWTPEDARKYGERAQCFVAQYSAATVLDGLHIDGKRTLGENIADNAGAVVAYGGLAKALARRGQRMDDPAAGERGYTPAQLFFLGWTIARCIQTTPDALRRQVDTDTHSPGRVQVILPVANSPAFREAFSCKEGTPMAPVPACSVW